MEKNVLNKENDAEHHEYCWTVNSLIMSELVKIFVQMY